ncbi:MAG: preprotein translocase subunit YajC [bacterium]
MRKYDIGDLFQGQTAPEMAAGGTAPAGGAGAPTGGAAAPAMGAPATGAGDGMGGAAMTATSQPSQKKKPPPGCFGGGAMGMLLPLVLMFVVFYFFLIRPQQKKQKEHQNMLGALRKGDEVITTGGVLGKITGLTDQYAVVEVQEKVRMKVLRSHIAGKQPGVAVSDSKR